MLKVSIMLLIGFAAKPGDHISRYSAFRNNTADSIDTVPIPFAIIRAVHHFPAPGYCPIV